MPRKKIDKVKEVKVKEVKEVKEVKDVKEKKKKIVKVKEEVKEVNKIEVKEEEKKEVAKNEEKTIEEDKKYIIDLFMEKVKDVIIPQKSNKHTGEEGYWLEKMMNIHHNSKNEPDIRGYEMKKDSKKITFGDFSATEYLFSKNKPLLDEYNGKVITLSRKDFIKIFGEKNPKKHNRYSWSGKPVPKYGEWNLYGQCMEFNERNDLCIYYDPSLDKRVKDENKDDDVKIEGKIMIAIWKEEKLKKHIDTKFNNKGFFILKKGVIKEGKDEKQIYSKICFGKPFTYVYFVEHLKGGSIIFDSGMYNGNNRNYSLFRGNPDFWNQLITEEY